MRLLLVTHEPKIGDDVGLYEAFKEMVRLGEISTFESFSLPQGATQFGSSEASLRKLLETAVRVQPEIILWQNIKGFPINQTIVESIKNIPSKPILAYQDYDAWGGLFKGMRPSMKLLAKMSDLVFSCGLGHYADDFYKAGAKRVLYSPHCVDTVRFGHSDNLSLKRDFDVVMIGSLHRSRKLPFLYALPGAKERFELVRLLGNIYKERFAVYGKHWPNLHFAKPARPFGDQEKINQTSWITVGWDHYQSIPYYFSDRLPIALMSGSVHVTGYHKGYENAFPPHSGIYWAKSPRDVVDTVAFLLSKPKQELIEIGMRAKKLAKERFTCVKVYRDVIRTIMEYRQAQFPL